MKHLSGSEPSEVLSVAILAGGKSKRMGSDKAFLEYMGMPFVTRISNEMLKVSNDIVVIIGENDQEPFSQALNPRIRILADEINIGSPTGGMISAAKYLRNEYSAILACDIRLVKNEVIEHLFNYAKGHSAAIPGQGNDDCQPLCAIYNIRQMKEAGLEALEKNKIGRKNLISLLSDIVYVDYERIREVDPKLESFVNVNSREDYDSLMT